MGRLHGARSLLDSRARHRLFMVGRHIPPGHDPVCAYFMDEHPVGLDATLDEGALSTVMHCRLDQMPYGQYGDEAWHVRACSAGDIAYSTAHPKESGANSVFPLLCSVLACHFGAALRRVIPPETRANPSFRLFGDGGQARQPPIFDIAAAWRLRLFCPACHAPNGLLASGTHARGIATTSHGLASETPRQGSWSTKT